MNAYLMISVITKGYNVCLFLTYPSPFFYYRVLIASHCVTPLDKCQLQYTATP